MCIVAATATGSIASIGAVARCYFAATTDHHTYTRFAVFACSDIFDLLEQWQALRIHATKDHMFAVQMRCAHESHEELRIVSVPAGICHAEKTRASVLKHKILVIKRATVYGLATRSVLAGDISPLGHKTLDNAMEYVALETQWHVAVPGELRRGTPDAQSAKILCRLGHYVCEQRHLYPAERSGDRVLQAAAEGDVKIHTWVGLSLLRGGRRASAVLSFVIRLLLDLAVQPVMPLLKFATHAPLGFPPPVIFLPFGAEGVHCLCSRWALPGADKATLGQ